MEIVFSCRFMNVFLKVINCKNVCVWNIVRIKIK